MTQDSDLPANLLAAIAATQEMQAAGTYPSARKVPAPAASPVIPEVKEVTDFAFRREDDYALYSDGVSVYAIPTPDGDIDKARQKVKDELGNAGVFNQKAPRDPERSYAMVDEKSATVKVNGKEVKAVKVLISPEAHGRDDKGDLIEFTTTDMVELMKAQKMRGGSGTQALDDKLNAIRTYRAEFKLAEQTIESQTALANFVDTFNADPVQALGAIMEENKIFLGRNSGNYKRDNNKIYVFANDSNVNVELKSNPRFSGSVDVHVTYPRNPENGEIDAIDKAVNAMLGAAADGMPRNSNSTREPFVTIPAGHLQEFLEGFLDKKIEGQRVASNAMKDILRHQPDLPADEFAAPATPAAPSMAQRVSSIEELIENTRVNHLLRAKIKEHVESLLAPKDAENVTIGDLIEGYQESKVRRSRISIEDLLGDPNPQKEGILKDLITRHNTVEAIRAQRKGQAR